MVTAGQLRDRITITTASKSSDSQGGRSASPSTLATVWANVRAAGANERLAAQAVGSDAQYVVTIRYRQDVTPQMKVSWTPYGGSATTLQILGVQPVDGQREFIQLLCGVMV